MADPQSSDTDRGFFGDAFELSHEDPPAPPIEIDAADGAGSTPLRRRRPVARYVAAGLGVVALGLAIAFGPASYQVLTQRGTTLRTPEHLAGLTLDKSANAEQTADYLRSAVAAGVALRSSVGAIYDDPADQQRTVMFFGGTSMVFYPGRELHSVFNLLDDRDDGLKNLRNVPAGRYGGEMQCGTSTGDGGDMTVCGWADHGSLAVALFPGRTVDGAATLMRQMRDGVQHRS